MKWRQTINVVYECCQTVENVQWNHVRETNDYNWSVQCESGNKQLDSNHTKTTCHKHDMIE